MTTDTTESGYCYELIYDGMFSAVREYTGRPDATGFRTFTEAKAALVQYLARQADNYRGAAREARSLRKGDVTDS